jgi:hypothetical protein
MPHRTMADAPASGNRSGWRRIDAAKHWLLYSLIRLRLPLRSQTDDPKGGLAFDFLADGVGPVGPKVLTGHDNGLITISTGGG